MKTYFNIKNSENFPDYLKLTAGGKEYYFSDDLTLDLDETEILDVDIEYVKAYEYLKIKSKNPLLKLLLTLLMWVLGPILFFFDNEGGLKLDKSYDSYNPFAFKKSFSVSSPNEKTVLIKFIEAKYDKKTKEYTPPIMKLEADGVIEKSEKATFSSDIFRREWKEYHVPFFTIALFLLFLLELLSFSIFAKVIREIPLYTASYNTYSILGMSFCSCAITALFVWFIITFVKANKLKNEVIEINTKE